MSQKRANFNDLYLQGAYIKFVQSCCKTLFSQL